MLRTTILKLVKAHSCRTCWTRAEPFGEVLCFNRTAQFVLPIKVCKMKICKFLLVMTTLASMCENGFAAFRPKSFRKGQKAGIGGKNGDKDVNRRDPSGADPTCHSF